MQRSRNKVMFKKKKPSGSVKWIHESNKRNIKHRKSAIRKKKLAPIAQAMRRAIMQRQSKSAPRMAEPSKPYRSAPKRKESSLGARDSGLWVPGQEVEGENPSQLSR